MAESWGYHLVFDGAGCDLEKISDRDNIYAFSKSLVKRIDMVAYGEPLIVHFGEGNKLGYTLVQLISTSTISCHFVEETSDLYLDVFSCKPFEPSVVEELAVEFFGVKSANKSFFVRQAPRAE